MWKIQQATSVSPSRYAVEKKKENNDICLAFCVTQIINVWYVEDCCLETLGGRVGFY